MARERMTIKGHDLFIDLSLGPDEVKKQLRKQAPALYQELVLGQKPSGFAAREGREQVAEQQNPFQAAMIGAGSTLFQLGAGARELTNRMFGDEEEAEQIRTQRESGTQEMEALREASPVATFAGESAPFAALPMGPAASVAGRGISALGRRAGVEGLETAGRRVAGSTATDAALQGAGIGLLESGGVNPIESAITGGVAGGAGTMAGRALFGGISGTPTPRSPAIARAEEAGFYVSPSERYYNRKLAQFEDTMERTPLMWASAGRGGRQKNQQVLNAGLRDALDLPRNSPLDRATMSQVAKSADDAFVYDIKPSSDGTFAKNMYDLAEEQTSVINAKSVEASPVYKILDHIDESGGVLDAKSMHQSIRELHAISKKSPNPDERRVASDAIREILEEVGRQHGENAKIALKLAVEKRSLAEAVKNNMHANKDGVVDYRSLLRKYYEQKQGVMPVTPFRELLDVAQGPPGDYGLGVKAKDISARTGLSGVIEEINPVHLGTPGAIGLIAGMGTGGIHPVASAALGVAGANIAGRAYNTRIPARMIDRGILGAIGPDIIPKVMRRPAERMGRAAALGIMGQ